MCIIVYRPKGAATRLSRETLNRCAHRNPHGFGMMWSYNGVLHTARYLPAERKDFVKRALVLQDADVPLVLHFRWATHGAVEKANTHPFVIEKGKSAAVHNGILSIPCVKGWSDTRTFVNQVLKRLPAGWEQDPTLYWMVDQATLGSKVAIMYADGNVTLLHKSAGISEGGIWYSNDGFRPGYEQDDWAGAAARWAAKSAAEKSKGSTKDDADSTSTAKSSASAFIKKGTLPIQSNGLYRFEGITICGWCLAREQHTDDALHLYDPAEGEQCELCYHSPLVPGSRDVKAVEWMKAASGAAHQDGPDEGTTVVEAEVEIFDEGRVCSGA